MSSSSVGKHAGGVTSSQPPVPEPSFAERARTLMHSCRIGSLSTLSRKQPGFPFGSLMPYSLDGQGRPIFLISTMAMHPQNLQADPRASLFVTESDAAGEALGASRVTLIGNVTRIQESSLAEARSLYLASYPDSKYCVDFEDFFFYRMDVLDVYYVGGRSPRLQPSPENRRRSERNSRSIPAGSERSFTNQRGVRRDGKAGPSRMSRSVLARSHQLGLLA